MEYNDRFVLLRRHSHKPDGGTWGLPAGKVEPDESDEVAVVRELFEETGYQAETAELRLLGIYDFTTPTGTINNFVTYKLQLKNPHTIILEDNAHSEYKWVTAEEGYTMPDLIFGLHDLFKMTGYIKDPNHLQ